MKKAFRYSLLLLLFSCKQELQRAENEYSLQEPQSKKPYVLTDTVNLFASRKQLAEIFKEHYLSEFSNLSIGFRGYNILIISDYTDTTPSIPSKIIIIEREGKITAEARYADSLHITKFKHPDDYLEYYSTMKKFKLFSIMHVPKYNYYILKDAYYFEYTILTDKSTGDTSRLHFTSARLNDTLFVEKYTVN